METSIIITIPIDDLIAKISEAIIARLELVRPVMPSQEQIVPELLTRQETADFLKISLVSLNKWTKQGKIPAWRISGRIRYYRGDVLKALKLIQTSSK